MSLGQATKDDIRFMKRAYNQAKKSYDEGGLPIGAVLVENGQIIAEGHNQRVQQGDPIAHGEMDCLRKAGRRKSYRQTVLYTTLSPCMMCSGTILQFDVPRVVVGEDINFSGNISFLQSRGVETVLLQDLDCIALMKQFIEEKPDLWNEDIAEDEFAMGGFGVLLRYSSAILVTLSSIVVLWLYQHMRVGKTG